MHPWRERLHRWFSPLAKRCPLSPNAITVVALLLNLAAAALFATAHFVPAIGLLIVGGLADAFDGIVARVQNRTSRFGDFLDHLCDRISDLAVVSGWMLGNHVRAELLALVLLAVMLNGYTGTQIEATWGERHYDAIGRGEFVLALVVFPIVSIILSTNGWTAVRGAGLLVSEWMSVLLLLFATLGIVQRVAMARRLGSGT
jgi:phosphatidylglycerophosphate synthase